MPEYPIIHIEASAQVSPEWMGSKPKQWVLIDDEYWLFKEARVTAGEDWSEKVAAEVGGLLGISVAEVQLAEMNNKRGSISRSFVDRDRGEILWHGNEILGGHIKGYDKEKRFGHGDHNLKNIRVALERAFKAAERDIIDEMWRDLAQYFVLDAVITNTDRHHENWGFLWCVQHADGTVSLELRIAPSFDHASSLGRELQDEKRQLRLQKKQIPNYVRKARGAVYITGKEPHGPCPLAVIEFAALRYPEMFRPILERVKGLNLDSVREVLQSVPDVRISQTARDFAYEMVACSKDQLSRIVL